MKPIVIYSNSKDNKITLTKEEFEAYLEQAYNTGHSDGYAAGKASNWWTYPNTYPTITWNTSPNTIPNPYEITCEAHNDIGG